MKTGNDFVVESKGHCFICLSQSSVVELERSSLIHKQAPRVKIEKLKKNMPKRVTIRKTKERPSGPTIKDVGFTFQADDVKIEIDTESQNDDVMDDMGGISEDDSMEQTVVTTNTAAASVPLENLQDKNRNKSNDISPPPSSWANIQLNCSFNPVTSKYKCNLCSREFGKIGFHYHYKNVHLKLRYKCTLCGKIFSCQPGYKAHLRRAHHGVTTFYCTVCNEGFKRKDGLERHQKKNILCNVGTATTKEAQFTFLQAKDIKVETESLNEDVSMDDGGNSGNTFLEDHMAGISGDDSMEPTPTVTMNSMTALGASESVDKEDRYHTTDSAAPLTSANIEQKCSLNPETGKYKCNLCSKEFGKTGCYYHYKNVHLKLRYKCSLCGKLYTCQTSCNEHRRIAHLGVTYKCLVCNQEFKNRRSFDLHQKKNMCNVGTTTTKDAQFTFQAKDAKVETESLNESDATPRLPAKNLSMKEANVEKLHNGRGEVTVQQSYRQALPDLDIQTPDIKVEDAHPAQNAMLVEDVDDNNYFSDDNDGNEGAVSSKPSYVSFTPMDGPTKVDYSLHRRFNPETGKHKCRVCSAELATTSSFSKHYQSAHLNVLLKCNLCGKIFKTDRGLKLHHDTVHVGVRVKCSVCGKQFTQPHNLKYHTCPTPKKKEASNCSYVLIQPGM